MPSKSKPVETPDNSRYEAGYYSDLQDYDKLLGLDEPVENLPHGKFIAAKKIIDKTKHAAKSVKHAMPDIKKTKIKKK